MERLIPDSAMTSQPLNGYAGAVSKCAGNKGSLRSDPILARSFPLRSNQIYSDTATKRFWAKVGPKLSNGCMEWTAYSLNKGYGMFRRGKLADGRVLAHRFSYEIHNGPIPEGMIVRHKCDNPKCVNPEHLLLGTQKDNVADMVARKRHAWKGGLPWEKLSDDDISDIRVMRGYGMGVTALAREYGVSHALISMHLSGKLLRYLKEF